MNKKEICLNSYKYFSKKEGNQHIAGLFGLEKILDIIELNKTKRILEVGLGIGSIAYNILSYAEHNNLNIVYDGTELNAFCLKAIKENLGENYNKITVYSDLKELQVTEKYDIVIIGGSDESLIKLKDIISEHGVIFIEGARSLQTKAMNDLFPKHKYTNCISDFKNPDYGPFAFNKWSGGGQLIYINPNTAQLIHFVKERVKTSFRYKIKRKFLS